MNKANLKNLSSSKFPTNGVRGIKALDHREFNDAAIEAMYTNAGSVIIWAGVQSTIPTDWLLCDGRQVNQADYPDLFAALGGQLSPWGVQNTTFNIPQINAGSVPIQSVTGQGNPKLAEEGGEATHVLTIEEMPKHSHSHRRVGITQQGDNILQGGSNMDVTQQATGETGGGLAHNNMPPFVGMFYIIKVK